MVDQFDVKLEDISPDTQLENLGFDSLSVVEFLFSLEDELKIKLSDQRLEIKTVGDLGLAIVHDHRALVERSKHKGGRAGIGRRADKRFLDGQIRRNQRARIYGAADAALVVGGKHIRLRRRVRNEGNRTADLEGSGGRRRGGHG